MFLSLSQRWSQLYVKPSCIRQQGWTRIPAEAIKSVPCVSVSHTLCTQVFHEGVVPSIWKRNIILPIPKGGSKKPRIPLNYRGISLLNTTCKVYRNILHQMLSSYLENNNLIANEQNGFRAGRNCLDHIYTINRIIQNRKLSKQSTFICFIDATKAFDSSAFQLRW